MYNISKLPLVSRNNNYSGNGIFVVFAAPLVYLLGLFDIFINGFGFLEILYVVAFLVGNFKLKFGIDGEQMYTIRICLVDDLKLFSKLFLAACDQSPQILKSLYFWIIIHNKSPKFNMMPGAIFDIVFQINHFVGIVHIFIDIYWMTGFLFVKFSHFSLDMLEVKWEIETILDTYFFFF